MPNAIIERQAWVGFNDRWRYIEEEWSEKLKKASDYASRYAKERTDGLLSVMGNVNASIVQRGTINSISRSVQRHDTKVFCQHYFPSIDWNTTKAWFDLVLDPRLHDFRYWDWSDWSYIKQTIERRLNWPDWYYVFETWGYPENQLIHAPSASEIYPHLAQKTSLDLRGLISDPDFGGFGLGDNNRGLTVQKVEAIPRLTDG